MLIQKRYTAIFVPSLVFLLTSFSLRAQFYNLPNDYNFSLLTEKRLAAVDSSIHTGLKPYIHFFSRNYVNLGDTHHVFKYIKEDPALDLVFYKHFLRVEPKKEKFKLRVDPLLNLETGKDYLNKTTTGSLLNNTRGIIGSGYIGDKFYFESLFAETQSFLPYYLSTNVKTTGVIPGQGRWKTFKNTGYDYAFSSGFFSIQVLKNLNIQAGHGKQKIGNGYRSLLLSDNSFNYPYARATQQWFKGRVQYTNIYAVLMNLVPSSKFINPNTERLFQKKAASFQYLSINVTKKINLGFFQGMIWKTADDHNKQHLDWHYFNPVIYTNLLTYGLDNKNNILSGMDLKVKLSDKINVYGQLMLDKTKKDTMPGGWGYQAGINFFDALGIKNLFRQAEYNMVKKGSYLNSENSTTDQSYSHYNQTLAFTPGCGEEFIFIADYKLKRFFVNARYQYQEVPSVNAVSAYTSYVSMVNARIGYLINPAYNLNACMGILYRTQNFSIFNTLNTQTFYFYLGFKTSIYNLYYDF